MSQQQRIAEVSGQSAGTSASRTSRSGWRLSVSLTLAVLLAGVVVWRLLLPLEADRRHLQTEKAGVTLVASVGGKLRGQLSASLRQMERLGRIDTARGEFERDADLFLRDFPGVLAIRYARPDSSFERARADVDASALFQALGGVHVDAQPARIAGYTQALSTPAEFDGHTVYFMVFAHEIDGQPISMTTAVDAQSWLGAPLKEETNYLAGVFDGDRAVLDPAHVAAYRSDAERFPIEGAGRPWSLVVVPSDAAIAANTSYLPAFILAGSALLALILGLSAQLAQMASQRKMLMATAEHRLAENDERRRDAEAARDVAHRDLGAILESITDGFIILDKNFHYVYVNSVAAEVAGKSVTDLVGHSLWDVFPDFGETTEARLLREAMRDGKSISFERLRQDGRYFAVRAYPHREGLAMYFHDVSMQRQVADRLRKSETLLRLAQSIASIGSFTYDIRSREEHWSDQMFALLAMRRVTPPSSSARRKTLPIWKPPKPRAPRRCCRAGNSRRNSARSIARCC